MLAGMSEPEEHPSIDSGESKHVSGMPLEKRERAAEVAAAIDRFGAAYLDQELTGFALDLWKRI